MNAKLDKMTKSAQSQRRRLSAATEGDTIVGKIREERNQSKQEEVSVWGPYRDGPKRYRLKISEKGEVRNVCYKTREDAETVKANLLAQAEEQKECTVGATVTAFCQYLAETRCIKEDSVRGAAQKLAWLPADALLVSLKPEQAERLYRELVQSVNPRTKKPPSAATQRARLTTARYFFCWAQKSGLCRQNPFASVQPIGRMNVGKKQLRIDEARRFEAVCLKQAESGDTAAFGALLMIYLGLRQSEVAARVKRDIDDEGRVLWIPSGKTKNAKRRLKIPEHLRPLLLTLMTEKESEERLFYPPNRKRSSSYYWAHVRRLCRLADVPVICPHSLYV
jgi:site-specific recombinase XerD